MTFAERAGARHLVLFHHDPMHTDAELEAMLEDARGAVGDGSLELELGYEGLAIALG